MGQPCRFGTIKVGLLYRRDAVVIKSKNASGKPEDFPNRSEAGEGTMTQIAQQHDVVSVPREESWGRRHFALLLVSGFYAFAALDRGIISLVLDKIRTEFGLTDTNFSAIIGFGFSIPQILLALPVARFVDRASRKWVVIISATVWSGATVLTAAASNVTQLLASRILVGAGESANSVYHSIISDLYDKNHRSSAIGVYYGMAALVTAIWFWLGGYIAQHYGWRWTVIVAGAPGLVLVAIVCLWFRDPVRGVTDGQKDTAEAPPFWTTVAFLLEQRTYLYMVLGNFIFGLGFGVLLFWYPAFLQRVHGVSQTSTGFYSGFLGFGAASFIGYLVGGLIVTELSQRDERWRAGYAVAALLLFAPAVLFGAFGTNLAISVTCFCIAFFLQSSMLGGIVALTQNVMQPRMRGTGAAFFNVISGLSALGIAPGLAGWMNDLLKPQFGAESVRYSFLLPVVFALIAAFVFFLATRSSEADIAKIKMDVPTRNA
jgi:MFS family permease